MADCTDIDTALANLSSKVDNLSSELKRLAKKQQECCDSKEQKTPETNLTALVARIAKLENYILSLEAGLTSIFNVTKVFQTLLKAVFR